MITELITFSEEHKAAATVAGMWLVREAHVIWPALVKIFPYCRDNGGSLGIAGQFFCGKKPTGGPGAALPNQPDQPTKPLKEV